MSCRRFLWLHIAAQCSGEDGEDILVDRGAYGEVQSKTGKMCLSQQADDRCAWVRSCGTPYGALFGVSGAIRRPLNGDKTLKMAKPPHNSR
jgi:hypothetical protein